MNSEQEIKEFVLNRIKELISTKDKKSLRTISELMGHSSTYLSNLARKKSMPSIGVLYDFCNHFGITLTDFFKPDYSKDKSIDSIVKLSSSKLDPEDFTLLYNLIDSLDKNVLRALLQTYPIYHEVQNKKEEK